MSSPLSTRFTTCLVLYNALSAFVTLLQLYPGSSNLQQIGMITQQWALLPLAQSQEVLCPCSHCGKDTYCHQMSLTRIPYGLPAAGIETLYLYGNNITNINSSSFRGMNALTKLILDKNNISRVTRDTFEALTSLDTLHLEHNKLRHVDDGTFSQTTKLRLLYLNDNQLDSFPVGISYLTKLEKLNIANNRIKRIHWSSFIQMGRLSTLTFWDNPLICDCNARELIRWLTTSSRGKTIKTTDSPPDACRKKRDKTVTCKKPSIESIEVLRQHDNLNDKFVLNQTVALHCNISWALIAIWKTPQAGYIQPYQRSRIQSYLNGTLVVSNLRMTDNGTYACHAHYSNNKQRASQTISIRVVKATKPTFVGAVERRVQAIHGEETRLTCQVDAIPVATVKWRPPRHANNLGPFNFTSNDRLRLENGGMTLVLTRTKKSDQGNWTCTAKNVEGMARRKISLEVDETSESSANDTMVIIIASAVSGGILVIVILSIVVVCYLLRKRRKAEENAIKTELSDGNPTNGTRVVYENPVSTEEYESEIDDDANNDSSIDLEESEVESKEKETKMANENDDKKNDEREKTIDKNRKWLSKKKNYQPSKGNKNNKTKKIKQNDQPTDGDGTVVFEQQPQTMAYYYPGQNQLQQPFEYQPQVKGFRL
ncbi:uncharacterized protein LOC143448289 isoform X1 [Clavelina lepadiformis]|uniref:uncharacterized protein LOC143448289 isoform X1 n=2 Tax=Clavelina lepadiformis TaxID=159417 RepID=UPI004041D8E6